MTRLLNSIPENRKIYGNCRVLSPEGILMFRCDQKKVNWYLNRNLATVVIDNPLTIKLNFKPKGLGNHKKEFGLSDMQNICVVCGSEKYLTKHHVVPYCYKQHLPSRLKSRNHHDILSVCVDCHEEYERSADKLKYELSIKYNSPLSGILYKNREVIKYSKICSTLLRDDINIPKKRINDLRNSVKAFFGIKRLTKSRLNKLSKIKVDFIKKTHGEMVVQEIDDFQIFFEMWRRHFIEKTNPEFLPKGWKIENKI